MSELPIELIEFHDARLHEIVISCGGRAVIYFAHLTVFKRVKEGQYEVWSHRARLELRELGRLSIDGAIAADDYLSDATVSASEGIELDPISLLDGMPIRGVRCRWASGATATLEAERARLIIEIAIRQLEDWNGPL